MALYGNLQFANVERLFNLGKANGGFFITSYVEGDSDENNLERALALRNKICDKGLTYIPIFCGNQGNNVLFAGKCCFYVINKNKNCLFDDSLYANDDLFKIALDFCREFNQQYFIFLDNGEVKSISKSGSAVGLFSPNVNFANLVSSVFPFSFVSSDDNEFFVRTFENIVGEAAGEVAGELHLRKEELPVSEENWIEAS